jgi:dienelactone hydrolase
MRRVTAGIALALAGFGCGRSETPKSVANDTAPTGPAIETREITYQQGGTTLKGFIAWDSKLQNARPGVLVVHEWWGHNDHARAQARRLAEAGYVGFALDMYGDNKVTTHPDSAQAFVAEAMKDPAVARARFDAALARLKQEPTVDSTRIGAIGYCFGGFIVLNVARSGADLDAVASFHGAIPPSTAIAPGTVTARVLIQTGGADPMVPAADVERFRKELDAAGARVQVITYPGAKHSFTNPNADHVGMKGLGYDPAVDRASWAALLRTLQESFS